MTTYYEAWQHIEAKKQVVRIRDHILGEFSRQVLSPLAVRNGLPPVARLIGKGFLSEADLDGIFARFGRGEINMDEFWKLAQRQN